MAESFMHFSRIKLNWYKASFVLRKTYSI